MSAQGDRGPLVYSCSGCSSAAQMANYVALRLDRSGVAEMSCVAGLGGDVASLVRLATSGRPIVALDGCPLVCVAATLRRHGLTPDAHVVLSDYGVRKRRHADFDLDEANDMFERAVAAVSSLAQPAESQDALTPGKSAVPSWSPEPTARSAGVSERDAVTSRSESAAATAAIGSPSTILTIANAEGVASTQ